MVDSVGKDQQMTEKRIRGIRGKGRKGRKGKMEANEEIEEFQQIEQEGECLVKVPKILLVLYSLGSRKLESVGTEKRQGKGGRVRF